MFADKFILPESAVYMCGHSLGPMPVMAEVRVAEALRDWQKWAVAGWNKGKWIELSTALGAKLASLIGAKSDEVVVCDSTVVNLFKVLKNALKLQVGRRVILTTDDNFPADLYIAQGIAAFDEDVELRVVKPEEIMAAINEEVAVLMLTHVSYRDAAVFDMKALTELAHRHGVLTVWDLSHSTGIVPLDLKAAGVDFALGCTYKYLSGGPGSPAFVYANSALGNKVESPIYGWLGHESPFSFSLDYASSGARAYTGGTPAILNMKALEAALELFDAGLVVTLHKKALEYGELLINALRSIGLNVLAPEKRGGHIAFTDMNGYGISRALIDNGVACDYRHPDLIRLCVNPLYLGEEAIAQCVEVLKRIMEQALYLKPEYNQKIAVT